MVFLDMPLAFLGLLVAATLQRVGCFVLNDFEQGKNLRNQRFGVKENSMLATGDQKSSNTSDETNESSGLELSRRSCLALFPGCVVMLGSKKAQAEESGAYDNPNIPPGPEERSGLVVLRVAEVAQFQEKILRAVAAGDLDFAVSPQQIAFGTQILLRNSNLDGNMKLMIYNEVPRERREGAIMNAVKSMNGLQNILSEASNIQRPFENDDLVHFADMYRDVRLQLNNMYECLPQKEKSKYYGYFMAVTEYEKKIAEGTYNPDVDGILKLDYN